MVAPLTVLGVLGKRIGQLSRQDRGDHPARPVPRAVRQPGARAADEPARHVLPDLQPRRPVQGGRRDHEDRPPVGSRPAGSSSENAPRHVESAYCVGLAIFTATVVAYTTYGGFLAAIWTDVFQSIIMAVGVMLLFPLAMAASGGLDAATYSGMAQTDAGFAFGPGAGRAFHPIGLAISFFFMWAITGMGQPSTLVRLMAFRDSRTLRYSIIYLTIYNAADLHPPDLHLRRRAEHPARTWRRPTT